MTYRELAEKLHNLFHSVRKVDDCMLVYNPWQDTQVLYLGNECDERTLAYPENWLSFDNPKPVSRLMVEAWVNEIDIEINKTVFAIRVYGKQAFCLRTN